jgi:hypothetical protein
MSRGLSLAGFQLTLIGRFWVTTEEQVVKSLRDFQTETYAYKENELDTFRRAWDSYGKAHLVCVKSVAANGQTYTKYAPMPYEHEVWNWDGLNQGDWRNP